MTTLKDAIDARRDALIALTQDLIRIPTLNPPGRHYRDICDYLQARMQPQGWDCELVRAKGTPGDCAEYPRWNIIARHRGAAHRCERVLAQLGERRGVDPVHHVGREAAQRPPGAQQPAEFATAIGTRSEVRAHRSVEKLRKQVLDMDKRRSKRRSRIVASLDRAEALLTEIQNAWR